MYLQDHPTTEFGMRAMGAPHLGDIDIQRELVESCAVGGIALVGSLSQLDEVRIGAPVRWRLVRTEATWDGPEMLQAYRRGRIL